MGDHGPRSVACRPFDDTVPGRHADMFDFDAALRGFGRTADEHEIAGGVGEQHVGDLRRFMKDRCRQNTRFLGPVGGAAPADDALRQQNRVGRGFEIGRNLGRDPVPQAGQQCLRQSEHPGAVGAVGVNSDAEQEADDQTDTAERERDAQQGPSPPRLFGEGIQIQRYDLHPVGQENRPSWRDATTRVSGCLLAISHPWPAVVRLTW